MPVNCSGGGSGSDFKATMYMPEDCPQSKNATLFLNLDFYLLLVF